MIAFPPCKINLGLHVLARRDDGYHDIDTCFYPVPWTDVLEVIPADTFSFTSSGLAVPGNREDNLCVRAYRLLVADFSMGPALIHLHKAIPFGAGLGGGSSDAAHTLRLLNEVFALGCSEEQLTAYAARLGSDCPFFVDDQPMIGTGRGELLSPVPGLSLQDMYAILVKPPITVSTAEAYAGITPQAHAHAVADLVQQPVARWKEVLGNDFEASVFKKYPLLEKIKRKLYDVGALYASMSGSGATLFGLFEKPRDIAHEFPGCEVVEKKLL